MCRRGQVRRGSDAARRRHIAGAGRAGQAGRVAAGAAPVSVPAGRLSADDAQLRGAGGHAVPGNALR